jgi:hypothetical protein
MKDKRHTQHPSSNNNSNSSNSNSNTGQQSPHHHHHHTPHGDKRWSAKKISSKASKAFRGLVNGGGTAAAEVPCDTPKSQEDSQGIRSPPAKFETVSKDFQKRQEMNDHPRRL